MAILKGGLLSYGTSATLGAVSTELTVNNGLPITKPVVSTLTDNILTMQDIVHGRAIDADRLISVHDGGIFVGDLSVTFIIGIVVGIIAIVGGSVRLCVDLGVLKKARR